MSLSAWMSLKTSVVWLPLGGGKGGVIVDPKQLSQEELERLTRAFAQQVAPFVGPETDVPAPDVNTTPQMMAWFADEYSKLVGHWTPGVITGKPLSIGGSAGREKATALGWLFVLLQYLGGKKNTLKGKTIAIQGAGNVGWNFALLAYQAGAKVVAISDFQGGIYDPKWLDITAVEKVKNEKKTVTSYTKAKKITNEDLLALKVDILVPAALENVITDTNAKKIQADLILELANGPVTPEADVILAKRKISIIPDVLANAGGVTVSYFEQVQNNMNYYWPEDEVNQKLEKIMVTATESVVATAKKYKTNLRNGAYIVSLRRILDAMKARG